MQIRSATNADADAISKLVIDAIHTQITGDFTPHGVAQFTEACAPGKIVERLSDGYHYWVADDNCGNIAGASAEWRLRRA